MSAPELSILEAPKLSGFQNYLENSLRDPFVLNLEGCSLQEVILACVKGKSRLHPNYRENLNSLIHNIGILEKEYHVTLQPVQITDLFWGYFVAFCQSRGLRNSTIGTMCNQLRSILNWAVKYNARVSPTYNDVLLPKTRDNEIALTADDVSRITYFDIDRFYANQRKDYRKTMERVRDMFVLSCNLFQRHSDMVRIDASCFDRNIFRIVQQKTGNVATVNIDKYSVDAKTTYRLLEKYNYQAPYKASIGNYNEKLHILMRDIGFTENIRIEEKRGGKLVVENVPKWKMITSHTARRTAITIGVLRGKNVHELKRCSGHTDLRVFDHYVKGEI